MDKSAVGHDYTAPLNKHESQKDYATGFGGKFGVQADRQDKSAVGWDHVEQSQKHQSQKDYAIGFGGKFGVQTDRQDKTAVGWEHHETVTKHESQTDHSKVQNAAKKWGLMIDFSLNLRALVESLEFKPTGWTKRLLAGNITRQSLSTRANSTTARYAMQSGCSVKVSNL
jgi:Repeat in HS1/Cortactin